jgi:hypothetical protein
MECAQKTGGKYVRNSRPASTSSASFSASFLGASEHFVARQRPEVAKGLYAIFPGILVIGAGDPRSLAAALRGAEAKEASGAKPLPVRFALRLEPDPLATLLRPIAMPAAAFRSVWNAFAHTTLEGLSC